MIASYNSNGNVGFQKKGNGLSMLSIRDCLVNSGLIIRFLRASRDTRLLTEKRQAHKRDRFFG